MSGMIADAVLELWVDHLHGRNLRGTLGGANLELKLAKWRSSELLDQ
jgi:hypothetical protein